MFALFREPNSTNAVRRAHEILCEHENTIQQAAAIEYGPVSEQEIASNNVEVPHKNCKKIKILRSKFIIMAIN